MKKSLIITAKIILLPLALIGVGLFQVAVLLYKVYQFTYYKYWEV